MRYLRFLFLPSLLGGLIVYLLVTDRPNPAHPRGLVADLLPSVVILLLLVVAIYSIATTYFRNRKDK